MDPTVTPAHLQTLALSETLRLWFPEHEPRSTDPAYKLFGAAKRQMKKLDLPCWRCDVHYKDLNAKPGGPTSDLNPMGACQLEAHHSELEFSLQNAVDSDKWWAASARWDETPNAAGFMVDAFSKVDGWLTKHPELDASDHAAIFRAYMESEGNLMQLCDVCHRSTHQGIHHIPYPEWRPLKVWRAQLPAHVQ